MCIRDRPRGHRQGRPRPVGGRRRKGWCRLGCCGAEAAAPAEKLLWQHRLPCGRGREAAGMAPGFCRPSFRRSG
eukprot:3399873-Prorocentrum_lima.AAC.1